MKIFPINKELLHNKYTMNSLAGLKKNSRAKLSSLLNGSNGTLSVAQAAAILGISNTQAAKLLGRFVTGGWLARVQRGLYIPVPLESSSTDIGLDDPWVIAARLYSPCYIGGWSAAAHWDLTEQIFAATLVMSTKQPRTHEQSIKGTPFVLRTVPKRFLFGLKLVWRDSNKTQVSDPTRTILDLLHDPAMGGGIRPSVDVLQTYLGSPHRNIELLLDYAAKLGNGAVYKRLGFLLDRLAPEEVAAIAQCSALKSKGIAKLDPALQGDTLVTRWRLRIPTSWRKEIPK